MKRIYIFIAVAALVSLVACHHSLTDLPGTWQATQENRLSVQDSYLATAQVSIQFGQPQGDASQGAPVTLSATLDVQDVTLPMIDSASAVSYALNMAGTATIQGTWLQRDDDEAVLSLDAKTLKINIDPDGVKYSAKADGQQNPRVVEILPRAAAIVAGQLTPAVKAEFMRYAHIDDIDVKGQTMKCEVGDRDLTFVASPMPLQ